MTDEDKIYSDIVRGLGERNSYTFQVDRPADMPAGSAPDGVAVMVFGAPDDDHPFAGLVTVEATVGADGRPSIVIRAWDEVLDPITPDILEVDGTVLVTSRPPLDNGRGG